MRQRKVIKAVLCLVVALGMVEVLICVNGSYNDWCFYDAYIERSHVVDDRGESCSIQDLKEIAIVPDKRTLEMFQKARDAVCEAFADYDSLNWEQFEMTQVVELADRPEWMSDWLYSVSGCVYAVYDWISNTVFVFQRAKLGSDYELEKILAHELIHALTFIGRKSILYEGLTECMSVMIYGRSQRIGYLFAEKFAELYVEKNGLKRAIETIPSGIAFDEINNSFCDRQNVMKQIEGPLIRSATAGDMDGMKAILDAMCHYAVNIGKGEEIVEDLVRKVLPDTGDAGARNYFFGVLRR